MGGLILIGIGVIFLLQNFGLADAGAFRFLWQFWPLIFILLGLKLVTTGSRVARQLVGLAAVLTVLYVFAYALYATSPATRDFLAPFAPYFPAPAQDQPQTMAAPETRPLPMTPPSSDFYQYHYPTRTY